MRKRFIPTASQRKERKILKDRSLQKEGYKQASEHTKSSKRKVRFGALLSFAPPKEHQTTKSFMVFLDKPLPWGIIVEKVTNALEELL